MRLCFGLWLALSEPLAEAERRYGEADRLAARDELAAAAEAYHEAGALFAAAAEAGGPGRARLFRRALVALRRASAHRPSARVEAQALCERLDRTWPHGHASSDICAEFPPPLQGPAVEVASEGAEAAAEERVVSRPPPGAVARTTSSSRSAEGSGERLGWGVGVGVAGALVAAVGGGAVLAGGREIRAVEARGGVWSPRDAAQFYLAAARVESARAGALGAGVGVLLALPGVVARGRRGAAIGVALGGSVAALGTALHVIALRSYARSSAPEGEALWVAPDRSFYAEHRRVDAATAGLLGAGIGWTIASVVALARPRGERAARGWSVSPEPGPGLFGAGVRGTFSCCAFGRAGERRVRAR